MYKDTSLTALSRCDSLGLTLWTKKVDVNGQILFSARFKPELEAANSGKCFNMSAIRNGHGT